MRSASRHSLHYRWRSKHPGDSRYLLCFVAHHQLSSHGTSHHVHSMLPVGWVVVYSLLSSVDPSLLCLKTHFSTLLPCTLFWRAEAVVLVKTWSTHEGCFSVLWPCPQVWLALPAWSSEGGLSQLSCPPQALGSHQFILSGGRDSLPCPQCSSGP